MSSIELKSRAKINLSIDVLGKREDGYHLVEMIMQTIDLYDIIKIKEIEIDEININSNSSDIPLNENNIVYKAAKVLKDQFNIKNGVEIFIESYNILMDRSIDEKTKDTILNVLHTYKEIKAINDISSAPVGYQYVLFLTIAVDGNMTTFQSLKLADKLEKDMIKLDNVYKAIIHIEPYLK